MNESEAIGERGEIILIEDGAGAYCHHHVQEYYKKMGIKKIDWPACKPALLISNPRITALTLNSLT